MILTAHQPVYLPWLGLFHKISLADKFVWFDDVQYQTKDWNNRNKIKTTNGPIWLSVPVERKNHFSIKVRDVLIDNSQNWAKKHLRSIEMAYKKAPYFDQYFPFFENLYAQQWGRLADLNFEIFKYFLRCFEIEIPIVTLTELNLTGQKSELVLNMCKKGDANIYIFGSEGKNYADQEMFKEAGVLPVFQEYMDPVYQQLHGDFEPKLSALDLLMNCGPESFQILSTNNIKQTDLFSEDRN